MISYSDDQIIDLIQENYLNKKGVIIYRYYEKNNKGDYNMSKVKQWAEDTAEKSVDNILKFFKNGTIDYILVV